MFLLVAFYLPMTLSLSASLIQLEEILEICFEYGVELNVFYEMIIS